MGVERERFEIDGETFEIEWDGETMVVVGADLEGEEMAARLAASELDFRIRFLRALEAELRLGGHLTELLDGVRADIEIFGGKQENIPKMRSRVMLRWLATDSSFRGRVAAAINSHCGPDLLELLANDEEPDVRRVVAEHRMLPIEALLRLADDRCERVRNYARSRLATNGQALGS